MGSIFDMSKKQVVMSILGGMIAGYLLGYSLGATKVLLFQGTSDGRSAYVFECDVNGEYRDENDNCRNFNKVKVSLGRATQISGRRWAHWGVALGILFGLSVGNSIINKNKKS